MFNTLDLVLIVAMSVALGWAAWGWAFKVNHEWIAKKRSFAHVASLLKAGNPDSWFARIFDDLAFGDYDDVIETTFEGAALVEGDPQVLFNEFDLQFDNTLAYKATDPKQLAYIQQIITKATTPTPAV